QTHESWYVAGAEEDQAVLEAEALAAQHLVGDGFERGIAEEHRLARGRQAGSAGGDRRREVAGGGVEGHECSARPSTANAASLTTSARVGWAWMVLAKSSLDAPKVMAATASAMRSPARGPTMCTPRTRSVCACARILTRPSVWPRALARPLAMNGKTPLR